MVATLAAEPQNSPLSDPRVTVDLGTRRIRIQFPAAIALEAVLGEVGHVGHLLPHVAMGVLPDIPSFLPPGALAFALLVPCIARRRIGGGALEDEEEEGPGRSYQEEPDEGPGGGAFDEEDLEGPGRLEGSGSG